MASDEKPPPTYSLFDKVKIVCGSITVEPIIICYVLPNIIGGIGMQHLYLEKACRVDLALNASVCDAIALHEARDAEADVQRYVATMFSYKNVLQSLVPTMLLLFIGAWSDRHGRRKPWILLPLVCETCTVGGFALTTYFFYELSVAYNVVIDGVLPVLTGGGYAFTMALCAHISSITTSATRTVRLGAATLLMNCCYTLGSALSGVVYVRLGFYGVYGVSAVMYLTGLIYGCTMVKEAPGPMKKSIGEANHPNKSKNALLEFFDWRQAQDTFRVAFRNEGARNRRARILAIMVLEMVIMGPLHGEFVVLYMFVRYNYQWDEMDYSLFCTYHSVVHICGTIFALIFFSKFMKLNDSLLGMISSISKVLSAFIYAFAPNTTVFYVAVIVEMFNGTSFIAMRSIISKLVPVDELGKIYSLFGLCEALMPLIYGPLYSFIYKHTINVMPGMFFIAGGILTVPSVLMFGWLYYEDKKDEDLEAESKTAEGTRMHNHHENENRNEDMTELTQTENRQL